METIDAGWPAPQIDLPPGLQPEEPEEETEESEDDFWD